MLDVQKLESWGYVRFHRRKHEEIETCLHDGMFQIPWGDFSRELIFGFICLFAAVEGSWGLNFSGVAFLLYFVLRRSDLSSRGRDNSGCCLSSSASLSAKVEFFWMGNGSAQILEGLPPGRTIKIHALACSELLKLVLAISKVFPEIEAARPRCSVGIDALCMLNSGVVKSKSLLQHCSESSVLYLTLTGNVILTRCKKSRNILEKSLSQIQDMVPILLAAKIAGIISDLRSADFRLVPHEEKAGKVLQELLHTFGSATDYTEESAVSAIRTVSSLLRITSQKALLIEKRSIRKLLDQLGESERTKRKILSFFLNLLNKYGKHIIKEQKDSSSAELETPFPAASTYDLTDEVELYVNYQFDDAQIKMFCRPVPPEEFLCPLTSRLMYDPVVIASGQTYEKVWIQKWFSEGNDICPKTKLKLAHLAFTSNTVVKDMILKWCAMHNLSLPDPKLHEESANSSEISTTSITSLSSSMNDLNLPLDFSNASSESSRSSDILHAKISSVNSSSDIDVEVFNKFSSFSWDYQCKMIEDFRRLLKENDASWSIFPLEKFIQLLSKFLNDARDLCDEKAQMSGCLLFSELLQKDRNIMSYMKENTFNILASFLATVVAKHVLQILELLSSDQQCVHKIVASGALSGIVNMLDRHIQELLEPALVILSNLSSEGNISSIIKPSDIIPKLVPLFVNNSLARYCMAILKNLCNIEDARLCIIETKGCISAIAEQLDDASHDNQECAVYILLSLCSQRAVYCQLVMNESVFPGLFRVSINGNSKAKAMALELLRILQEELNNSEVHSGTNVFTDSTRPQMDENPPPRSTRFLGKIVSNLYGFTSKNKRLK